MNDIRAGFNRFSFYEEQIVDHEKNILDSIYDGDFDAMKNAVQRNPECVTLREKFSGATALHFAVSLGNYSFVRYLLSCSKVDVRLKDFAGFDALDRAFIVGHEGVFRLISKAMWPEPQDDATTANSRDSTPPVDPRLRPK